MSRKIILMQCGCVSQGTDGDGNPVCVVHAGLHPGWNKPSKEMPDLTGRIARCSYGGHADVPSDYSLPFFEYLPNQEKDRYYCGCYGWD